MRCPRCGNEGYLAPGNHPQLTDDQIDTLSDAQFETYLQNGFEMLVPTGPARRPWGKASPTLGQTAAGAGLAVAIAWSVLLASGPLGYPLEVTNKLLLTAALVAAAVAAIAFGHWAYRARSGSQRHVVAALVLAWLTVLPATGLAQDAYTERECLSSFTGAVWFERGAADALRAHRTPPPEGNPDFPSPFEPAPRLSSPLEPPSPLSALTRIGHAGTWAHYQAFFENGTYARITVQSVDNATLAEAELRGFMANLTGRPAASMAELAQAIMADLIDSQDRATFILSGDGTIEALPAREPPGLLRGPFDLKALHQRTGGRAPWGFDWGWASRSVPLLDDEGQVVGSLHYTAIGAVQLQSEPMPVTEMQRLAARALHGDRFPSPTLERFSAYPAPGCR